MDLPRDERPKPRLAWVGQLLAVAAGAAGAVYGYGFGLEISGRMLGIVLALNSAVFGALIAGAVADRLLRWRERGAPQA